MSSTYIRYEPGSTPAVATDSMAVLVGLPDDDPRVRQVQDAVARGAEAEDVLDALLTKGLRQLPDFVICHWLGDAFRIVARGTVEVRPEGQNPLPLTNVPWTEGTLRSPAVTARLTGAPATSGVPGRLQGLQHVSEFRFATGELAERLQEDASGAGVSAVPVEVLAARCPHGHPTPAFAPVCRVCGAPVPAQDAVTIQRPTLGVLRLSTGQSATLDRGVILGRGPSIPADYPDGPGVGGAPRLLPIRDPNAYVSVQHLEVSLDYWNVMVRDLRSTGGTKLVLANGRRQALTPGQAVVLPPGAGVLLAETVTATFDATP